MKTFKDLGREVDLLLACLPSRFNIGEEFSNLVSVHARCGNLDGAGPVVIVVAQIEG